MQATILPASPIKAPWRYDGDPFDRRKRRARGEAMSDYRLMAERCVQLAIKAKHDADRSALLDFAGEWLELAEPDARTARLTDEIEALKRPRIEPTRSRAG